MGTCLIVGLILLVLVALYVVGLILTKDREDDSAHEALTWLGGCVLFIVISVFVGQLITWNDARTTAEVINKEYGTNYTIEEVKTSEDAILQSLSARTR